MNSFRMCRDEISEKARVIGKKTVIAQLYEMSVTRKNDLESERDVKTD